MTPSAEYLKFTLSILDAYNQGWSVEDITNQFLELKMNSSFIPTTDREKVAGIISKLLDDGLKILEEPNLLNNSTLGLTPNELAGFQEAFNNRKASPETKCWAVTFSLTVGSKARVYCLAATRDDAIAMTRAKVLSGKLEKIVQVDVKAFGHNHELVAEVCVNGGIRVEIV